MCVFDLSNGKPVLQKMVTAIQENKAYLGEIDGLIGDGDHGMNMNKGFSVFEKRYADETYSLAEGFHNLGEILMNEIGGSMGPIYGTFFMEMGDALDSQNQPQMTLQMFAATLKAGLDGICEIVDARVGDKTLIDTLSPAVDSLKQDSENGISFSDALHHMISAAEDGKCSTKDLVAKYGRSSRLGERSRGVLDAGATSCCIILTAMAQAILDLLPVGGAT